MLETLFYIVLTAYTATGENFHSNLSIPFDSRLSCTYYLKNRIDTHPLPFSKNESGEHVVTYDETEYVVDFWSHQCEEFYFDTTDGKWKTVPNSI